MIELIVTIVIAGMFVGFLALMFVNGLQAQEQATARDTATGRANVVSSQLHTSIRHAATIRVSESGTRVDATVAQVSSTLTWECRAWKLSGGSLYYSVGATARPANIVTGRNPLATGLTGILGSGAGFQQGTGSVEAQKRLTIGLDVAAGGQTVRLSDAVTAQVVIQGSAPTC
ncbi:hypothetical protein LJR045_001105 [Microbacterium sp. LjRoot45]|uniref:hypothetical protein n=1 Tax=Microbacterium sp. LjRoot45 TaxID=3342329 RepID=UPI003ED02845